jgi:two-component system, NarL family, nitrate/nitrite response regulator NarL
MNMDRIRLLLVDDHILFRESLGRLLSSEPDFDVVGQCGTAQEALEFLGRTPVDLVLLDFNLPDLPGDEVVRLARGAGNAGKILIVTGAIDGAQSSEVLQQGAAGIFLKHNPVGSLLRAIRMVAAGDAWVDRQVIQYLAAREPLVPDPSFQNALTKREKQVLAGVLEGLTNLKIADRLEVTEGAVKSVLQQLFKKTNVRTRSQLVRVAVEASIGQPRGMGPQA